MQVIVYTDGSAINNPRGPGGWAWWIDDDRWAAGGFRRASNQYAELYAILACLRALPPAANVMIRSDSQYSIDCLTKWIAGWKRNGWRTRSGTPVSNGDLIREIDNLIARRIGFVMFEKVKGHSGDRGNDAADAMCSAASRAVADGRIVQAGPGWLPLGTPGGLDATA